MGILRLESKVKSHEYVWGEWGQRQDPYSLPHQGQWVPEERGTQGQMWIYLGVWGRCQWATSKRLT